MNLKGEFTQKALVTLAVIMLLLVIVLVIALVGIIFSHLKNNYGNTENLTYLEIISKSEQFGENFCEVLNVSNSTMSDCLYFAVKKRALSKENPDYCNRLPNQILIDSCVIDVVFTLVAIEYYDKNGRGEGPMPSNIKLCDKIRAEEDRNACMNPRQLVFNCGGTFCYFK